MGRVYIVRNHAFWDVFKIGITDKETVKVRLKQLNAANVPQDFEILAEYECGNPDEIEALFHRTFEVHRHYTDSGRKTEFFSANCPPWTRGRPISTTACASKPGSKT